MQTDSLDISGRHIAVVMLAALVSTLVLALWASPARATTFSPTTTRETSDTPMAVAVGDVNDDGRDDIVVTNFNSNSIALYLQETSGTLTDAINYTMFPTTKVPVTRPGIAWRTTHPAGVSIGDLSGDGDNDIIVADEWNHALFYFQQDNPTSMTDPLDNTPDLWQQYDMYFPGTLHQPPGRDPKEVFSTEELQHDYAFAYRFHFDYLDLNQAGDALWMETESGRMVLGWATPSSGTDFWTPIVYTTNGSTAGIMKVKFVKDKDAEYTTSEWLIDAYEVWYDHPETHPSSMPYGVGIGDLYEQSSGLEFATADSFIKNYQVFGVSGGEIYKISSPVDERTNIIDARSYGIAVGDLNNDRTDDFAMAGWDTGKSMVIRQTNTGWHVRTTDHDVEIGANPFGIALGDLNRDGRTDIASTSYGENKVTMAFQNTAAFFDRKRYVDTGSRPMGLTVDDVTADGADDIVVAESEEDQIGVFAASTPGTFTAEAVAASGEYPYAVATGDLDGDGGTEIVSTDSNDDQITVYQPRPTVSWSTPSSGQYVRGTIYPTVTAPTGTGIASVDFYLDGVPIASVSSTPYRFELDTTALDNGTHEVSATASDVNGHSYTTPDRSFKVDNSAPSITSVSANPSPFYPIRRDGYKDNCNIRFRLNEAASAQVRIYSSGTLVRTLTKNGAAGWNSVWWDGKRNGGRRVVGGYTYRIRATDNAGNTRTSGSYSVKIKYYVLVLVAPNKVVLVPH